MKKMVLTIAMATFVIAASAQKSIDALFEKYGGKDGFTTVTLNGGLSRLAGILGGNDKTKDKVKGDIYGIRILTQDDKSLKTDNFYDMVIKDIDIDKYEEFMRVKDSKDDLRILVRTEGKRFRELLLISGGDDNSLIQIKGDLSLEDAANISNSATQGHNQESKEN
jgi:Domain of unknown function (DUF4252)